MSGRIAEHGTRSRYNTCRCELCRASMRDYMATLRLKEPPTHGLSGYKNYYCRCDVCRAAKSHENRRRTR